MASNITENSTLAKRYAQAFFEICLANGSSENAFNELKKFNDAVASSCELSDFITNQAISKKTIAKTIAEICVSLNISKNLADFLSLVIASRRGNLLSEITKSFEDLINKSSGKSKAIITSAKRLDEKLLNNITNILSQKLNKTIIAENICDKNILGGLKIQIGSTLIDDSISEKLNGLKKVLSN